MYESIPTAIMPPPPGGPSGFDFSKKKCQIPQSEVKN